MVVSKLEVVIINVGGAGLSTVIMKTSVEYLTMLLDHQFGEMWQSKSRMPEEQKNMFVFYTYPRILPMIMATIQLLEIVYLNRAREQVLAERELAHEGSETEGRFCCTYVLE